MSIIFNSADMAVLRYAHIHRHLAAYLDDLDPERFRRLGDKGRDAFIREGVTYCGSIGLEFLEQFEYVHFIMYFLGTHFHVDPRYQSIVLRLADKDLIAAERIQNAHVLFAAVGDRFIGEGFGIAIAAMKNFTAICERTPDQAFEGRRILAAFYEATGLDPDERGRFPERAMVDAAAKGAEALGINVPQGQNFSLALALWLGVGFYRDPLFPWVAEVLDKTKGGPFERAKALKEYCLKILAEG